MMALAIFLTFLVTALGMTVIFMYNISSKEASCKRSMQKEIESLKQRIKTYEDKERDRREQNAYQQGLHDGRATDALYRQVVKKYNSRDHADIMMNGEPMEE